MRPRYPRPPLPGRLPSVASWLGASSPTTEKISSTEEGDRERARARRPELDRPAHCRLSSRPPVWCVASRASHVGREVVLGSAAAADLVLVLVSNFSDFFFLLSPHTPTPGDHRARENWPSDIDRARQTAFPATGCRRRAAATSTVAPSFLSPSPARRLSSSHRAMQFDETAECEVSLFTNDTFTVGAFLHACQDDMVGRRSTSSGRRMHAPSPALPGAISTANARGRLGARSAEK